MARGFLGPAILTCTLAFGAVLNAGGQRASNIFPAGTPTNVGHWQLVADPQAGPALVVRVEAYRLVSGTKQLTIDSALSDRVVLADVNDCTPDIWLHRANGRPADGTLNESRALYFSSVGGYLVAKPGAPDPGLTVVPYATGDESDAPLPAGIAQWQFQTLPDGQARDHRHRPMATPEVFALYNVVVKDFLVFDRETQTVRWLNGSSRQPAGR
jgi:hypothetical protein